MSMATTERVQRTADHLLRTVEAQRQVVLDAVSGNWQTTSMIVRKLEIQGNKLPKETVLLYLHGHHFQQRIARRYHQFPRSCWEWMRLDG